MMGMPQRRGHACIPPRASDFPSLFSPEQKILVSDATGTKGKVAWWGRTYGEPEVMLGGSAVMREVKMSLVPEKCSLFQVIPGNDQDQPEIEHETEILRNPRNYGIEVFQVRNKKHDEP
jgi:hypothetical protein